MKKAYTKPSLQKHGKLEHQTQTGGGTNGNDGPVTSSS